MRTSDNLSMGIHRSATQFAVIAAVCLAGAFGGAAGFGVSVAVDKAEYVQGEPVKMTLEVFNRTAGQTVTLPFFSSQRYDFLLEDESGKKIWRWSDGRMFAQVVGSETLDAATPELSYSATFEGELEPGVYRLTGTVTQGISATTRVVVH